MTNKIISIGDLHGNSIAYFGNLQFAGLVDEIGNWNGGDSTAIFHGDFVAERFTDGVDIFLHLNNLRKKAQQAGGDILTIAGNHEDIFISYLTGKPVASINNNYKLESFHWMNTYNELKPFVADEFKSLDRLNGLSVENRKEILENMRNRDDGKILLDELCRMKLVIQIDNVLYLHTSPTKAILEAIFDIGMDKINQIYQEGVKNILLSDIEASTDLIEICDIFLSSDNRKESNDLSQYARLVEMGVKVVIHGHNGKGGNVGKYGDVQILNNDYSYGKHKLRGLDERSVIIVEGENVLMGNDITLLV